MKLRTGWAVVLLIVLVLFAVCFGAYRGWSGERARVEENYSGLEDVLPDRVEVANYVLTVAKRHLPRNSELIVRLENDLAILDRKTSSLVDKASANAALTRDADALLESLKELESLQADARDLDYVNNYLPKKLGESESKILDTNYNIDAEDFNQRLNGTFSGWIAKIMGVKPLEIFAFE